MLSSIKIDLDEHDTPFISIKNVSFPKDLRDRALDSFLKKLGFNPASSDGKPQIAQLEIKLDYAYSGLEESGVLFSIYPIIGSAKIIEKKK